VASSTATVVRATPRSTFPTSPSRTVRVETAATYLVSRPICRESTRLTMVAIVMTPKPPSWMSTRMTTCPSPVQ